MNSAVAVPQLMIGLENQAGQMIQAPLGVWLGALLASLPPEWREDVINIAGAYMAQHEPQRIVTP